MQQITKSFFNLLEELNIPTDDLEIVEESEPVFIQPLHPQQDIFDNLFLYNSGWGNHCLSNQNEFDGQPIFAIDYDQEISYEWKKKHRYSRKDRFRFTIYQLLGVGGEVPLEIILKVKSTLGRFSKRSKLWNSIRKILKDNNWRKFYNRIPSIIIRINNTLGPKNIENKIPLILEEFNKMDFKFNNELHEKWNRSYFLNLRFVALKLIEKYNIQFPYKIPFVRTLRKRKYLDDLYNQFFI